MNAPTRAQSIRATDASADRTSWPATFGSTRARSRSSAASACAPSRARITSPRMCARTPAKSLSPATPVAASSRARTRRNGTPRFTSSRRWRRKRSCCRRPPALSRLLRPARPPLLLWLCPPVLAGLTQSPRCPSQSPQPPCKRHHSQDMAFYFPVTCRYVDCDQVNCKVYGQLYFCLKSSNHYILLCIFAVFDHGHLVCTKLMTLIHLLIRLTWWRVHCEFLSISNYYYYLFCCSRFCAEKQNWNQIPDRGLSRLPGEDGRLVSAPTSGSRPVRALLNVDEALTLQTKSWWKTRQLFVSFVACCHCWSACFTTLKSESQTRSNVLLQMVSFPKCRKSACRSILITKFTCSNLMPRFVNCSDIYVCVLFLIQNIVSHGCWTWNTTFISTNCMCNIQNSPFEIVWMTSLSATTSRDGVVHGFITSDCCCFA